MFLKKPLLPIVQGLSPVCILICLSNLVKIFFNMANILEVSHLWEFSCNLLYVLYSMIYSTCLTLNTFLICELLSELVSCCRCWMRSHRSRIKKTPHLDEFLCGPLSGFFDWIFFHRSCTKRASHPCDFLCEPLTGVFDWTFSRRSCTNTASRLCEVSRVRSMNVLIWRIFHMYCREKAAHLCDTSCGESSYLSG